MHRPQTLHCPGRSSFRSPPRRGLWRGTGARSPDASYPMHARRAAHAPASATFRRATPRVPPAGRCAQPPPTRSKFVQKLSAQRHKSAAITVWIEALLAFQAPRARFLWVEARRLGLLLVPSKPSLHLGLYQRHDGIRRASRSAKHRCSQNEPENHLVPEISLRGLFVEKILSLVSNCLQIC